MQVHRVAAMLVGTLATASPAQPPTFAARVAAVDGARYALVGEAHFSREIPRFTVALCREMATHGLLALATETGPEAARIVDADLRSPDRVLRLSAFTRAHPDAMAFANGADESDMAAACAEEARPAFKLWGLDQEFFGASGFLLEGMAAADLGPVAAAAVGRLRLLDRAATSAAVASGSPGKFLIYAISDGQMNEAASRLPATAAPARVVCSTPSPRHARFISPRRAAKATRMDAGPASRRRSRFRSRSTRGRALCSRKLPKLAAARSWRERRAAMNERQKLDWRDAALSVAFWVVSTASAVRPGSGDR